MRSVFDAECLDELLERLGRFSTVSERQWGTMSPGQAMEHMARALDVATGREVMKQALIGKLISWMVWKKYIGEGPMPKNLPTFLTLIATDQPDFEATRARLAELITDFHNRGESGAEGKVHGFFGPLTGKQWGETQWKHLDHHFRQFGI